MAYYTINGDNLTATATAIRSKLGTSANITPANFASNILNIPTGTVPNNFDILYDNTITVNTTSTSATTQLTISGTMTSYNAILFSAFPVSAATTALSLQGVVCHVMRVGSNTYPSTYYGRYEYLNSSSTKANTTYSSSSGYAFIPVVASTTLKINTRCRSNYITSITGDWKIVAIGIK